MSLNDYLNTYKDISFKESPFNEIDALIFSSLAYPHYECFLKEKRVHKAKEVESLLEYYDTSKLIKRKRDYIRLLEKVLVTSRYNNMKLVEFEVTHDKDTTKQFQAISFLFKDYLVVSFCGTDGTVVGLKEDLNMSFLDVTNGEAEGIKYLARVTSKYKRKHLIVVGHSKGGRTALISVKSLKKRPKMYDLYLFDSPNFYPEFYDEEYKKIESHIHSFVPDESIIGRLITDCNNMKIVKSSNSLIMQHDTSSWLIEDNHFVYTDKFSKRSDRICKTLLTTVNKFSKETKQVFSNTLFDIIERLDIKEFSGKQQNLEILKDSIKKFPIEWKNTPKDERKIVKDVVFTIIGEYLKGK